MTTEFTPLASLLGGSLIGVSAVLLMLCLGRIMGATGLLAGAIFPHSLEDWSWRCDSVRRSVDHRHLVNTQARSRLR